jgi:glycine cleavage system H protein
MRTCLAVARRRLRQALAVTATAGGRLGSSTLRLGLISEISSGEQLSHLATSHTPFSHCGMVGHYLILFPGGFARIILSNFQAEKIMPGSPDLRYLESHEWHKLSDGIVTIGISKFAVDELTDITYLDVRKKSGQVKKGQPFAEIESVKATSEIYSGIDGEVVAFNQAAIDNPAMLNEDPYDKGWLIKIKPSNPSQLDALKSAAEYEKSH